MEAGITILQISKRKKPLGQNKVVDTGPVPLTRIARFSDRTFGPGLYYKWASPLISIFVFGAPISAMDRFKNLTKLQVEVEEENGDGGYDGEKALEAQNEEAEVKEVAEEMGQFTGLKVRRRAALFGECKGDYVGVPSDPFLHRILTKQG